MPPTDPVTRSATTTTFNPVELRPFQVLNLVSPTRWDPSAGVLPVSWEINDPNRRIQNGRVLYKVQWHGNPVIVDRRQLNASQWTQGPHDLPLGDRWDGTIREGIPERNGEVVAADLSIITVEIEVWNTSEPAPAPGIRGGHGRTEREGEWRSSAAAAVEVDAIIEARWDTGWVIPAGDPQEPAKGKAGMIIRVKNVRDGTPVHLAVKRIQTIDTPFDDFDYVDDVGSADQQAGMQGAVVRGNRVVLANGNHPTCEFNNYDEHWIHDGNNFYAFWIAFGEGDSMPASERDYVNHEPACLHMRFTVFIHTASSEFEVDVAADNRLHQFFRGQTRYYRSYLLTGAPRSTQSWVDHFKHRYIVVINGHGSCTCFHADHPKDTVPATPHHPASETPKQMYHSGFDPDLYICPDQVLDTAEARRTVAEDSRHYLHHGRTFGGCAHGEKVLQTLVLGRVSGHRVDITPKVRGLDAGSIALLEFTGHGHYITTPVAMDGVTPRMFLYTTGCRSMIVPYLGSKFTNPTVGTRYYAGWVYSVAADSGDAHLTSFMTRWIKGTSRDPAPNEYDTTRIEPAFRDASALGNAEHYHPRIMDRGGPKIPSSGTINDAPSAISGGDALA